MKHSLKIGWCLAVSGLLAVTGCRLFEAKQTYSTQQPVGQLRAGYSQTPANQILTPVGILTELTNMRPQALALSPDGSALAVSGKTPELVLLDPRSGKVRQRVALPNDNADMPTSETVSDHYLSPDKDGQLSFTGLLFSPNGRRIFLSNVNGSIKVFSMEHGLAKGLFSMKLPRFKAGSRNADIPAGLAISPDGKYLYVALNLSNQLLEMDAQTGQILRLWETGVAPYAVVIAGSKAYVSNWGGRRPASDSVTGPAGQDTLVRVDPVRHIANEGSITIIDLAVSSGTPAQPIRSNREILAGLHTSALAVSPNGRWLVAANSASDTLSVIDTRTDAVIQTISARQNPSDLFGAIPDALAFDASGRTLYVCNAAQNAVAVIDFQPGEPCLLRGLIPVGWFPGDIVCDSARQRLYVANIKGIGSSSSFPSSQKEGFNSRQYCGSVSLIQIPGSKKLEAYTRRALANMRYGALQEAKLPARPDQPPRPMPERAGEPSVFKHVVYIIKENRTYDQVFGDIKAGNGNASLCIFGEHITPNHHALAREFVLLDNTYCSGILSADGHQWADSSITTDYMERSFAGFPRSYPDGMDDTDIDALSYSPAGFIWDNAIQHRKTLRDYGEFAITEKSWKDPSRKGKLKWIDHYREFLQGTQNINLSSRPAIESLRPYLATNTVGWDMSVPDVFRSAQFVQELKQYEASGQFPNLVMICLPNNHTSGTSLGYPTPAASVADNDLALGQIVESISHSRFWPETCIFVIEDDPQNGWDHVSGYRTVAFVISPYTKRHAVVSTQYNQTSILRSIELVLGLPPMNQMDATATPMSDCFTERPDFTPYTALTNNIPLDQMNPSPSAIADPLLRRNALRSAKLPLEKVDQCPEDVLNRILWHAMKGPSVPFPTWAVTLVPDKD